eukprot:CAMPEP_0197422108 /NCGR_PEP_ID=MMETSP1170-20131217/13814_1 /TAXON_ID=54406 /ORGANISM="Sarcinochrysis sp, Strain CCMP770" /LENGTH=88 /DNA_ID=CAMNT_0042949419 /DNA_START=42 /DNA_END=309 /DNA_ORIENTATION=+
MSRLTISARGGHLRTFPPFASTSADAAWRPPPEVRHTAAGLVTPTRGGLQQGEQRSCSWRSLRYPLTSADDGLSVDVTWIPADNLRSL